MKRADIKKRHTCRGMPPNDGNIPPEYAPCMARVSWAPLPWGFSFGTSQIAQTRRGALKQQAGNTCLHATSCKLESPKHSAAHFAKARDPILLIECIPFFVVLPAAKHYAAHMARPERGKQRIHELMAQAEPLVFREKVDVQVRGV